MDIALLEKEAYYDLLNKMFQEKHDYITLEEVGRQVGCCVKTLRKQMKKNNLYDDCPDVFRTLLKTIHVFDKINFESAYWLGYLMADGCFVVSSKRPNKTLMLECKYTDKEILEKFCDFIKIRKERITIGHHGASVALAIADSNFSTSVSEFGIVPNKSHIEIEIPDIIANDNELFLQFLKGIIDGDGTIHTAKSSKGVSFITNSKTLAIQCKDILSYLLPEPTSIWILTRDKNTIPLATQNLYILKIGTGRYKHSNINYLFEQFYKNKPIILTRKYELMKTLIDSGSL